MRHALFGRTGLRVSELALGAGTFGAAWGWGSEADEARAVFDGFAEAGGTFLDCSDVHQFGEAERMLGALVAADRDHFVLATKYTAGGVAPSRPRPGLPGGFGARADPATVAYQGSRCAR